MRPRELRFSDSSVLRPSSQQKLVNDDEIAKYLQRVNEASAELQRMTGRKPTPNYTVTTSDAFSMSSDKAPF